MQWLKKKFIGFQVNFNKYPKTTYLIAFIFLIILFLVINHFFLNKDWADWTGFGIYSITKVNSYNQIIEKEFHSRTLFDWIGIVLIPIIVAIIAYLFNKSIRDNEIRIAKDRFDNEQTVSINHQRETTLQNYFNNISELILNQSLIDVSQDNNLNSIIRARTISTIFSLDSRRINILLNFLREMKLIGINNQYIKFSNANFGNLKLKEVDFNSIDFENTDFTESDLIHCNLSNTIFKNSIFENSNISGSELNNSNFSKAKINKSKLNYVRMDNANLDKSNISNTGLNNSSFKNGNFLGSGIFNIRAGNTYFANCNFEEVGFLGDVFVNCNFENSNFSGSIISSSKFKNTNMRYTIINHSDIGGSDFSGSIFIGAKICDTYLTYSDFSSVNFSEVDFSRSDLTEANFQNSYLKNAIVSYQQLSTTQSIEGAILPDGSVFHGKPEDLLLL